MLHSRQSLFLTASPLRMSSRGRVTQLALPVQPSCELNVTRQPSRSVRRDAMQERQRNRNEKLRVLGLISACVESNVRVFPAVDCYSPLHHADHQLLCIFGGLLLDVLQAITQRFEEFAGRSAMVCYSHRRSSNCCSPFHYLKYMRMPFCCCCRSGLLLLLQQSLQLLRKGCLDLGIVVMLVCMEPLLCCWSLFQPCLLQCPKEGWGSSSRKQSLLL